MMMRLMMRLMMAPSSASQQGTTFGRVIHLHVGQDWLGKCHDLGGGDQRGQKDGVILHVC